MGKALYRKYRSRKLSEVVGQKHVTDLLQNALKQGRTGHAYLFTGPRGVGKTSVARILAHEINEIEYCDEGSHLDIIEIDAASNNSVDDVRNLREKVAVAPTMGAKKIYIIDEVHMLSKPAFNALLKTLEEPPEHVVFILATTDAHKLPATIVSRSQQFVFRLVEMDAVVEHLRFIAGEEKIKISDEALELIARKGGGSFRDSISLLDQVANIGGSGEISREAVEKMLGLATDDAVSGLIESYQSGDAAGIVGAVNELVGAGTKPEMVAEQLIQALLARAGEEPELLELADRLTEVARAGYPEVKLMAVLTEKARGGGYKVAAVQVEAKKEVVVEVAKRGRKVVEKKEAAGVAEVKESSDSAGAKGGVEGAVAVEDLREFNWEEILSAVKNKHMAGFTVLSKCDYEIMDEKLVVYAKTKFYRDRINTGKFKQIMGEELAKTKAVGLEIEVLAQGRPPSEGVAAKIAGIMGGGEEVQIDG